MRFESGWKKNDPGCRIAKCSQKMTKSPEIPSKFSGRLRRPGKIGYFGVANLDFTREIVHLRVSKPQNFPAAEGGRKLTILDPPNRRFRWENAQTPFLNLANFAKIDPSQEPPRFAGSFAKGEGSWMLIDQTINPSQ